VRDAYNNKSQAYVDATYLSIYWSVDAIFNEGRLQVNIPYGTYTTGRGKGKVQAGLKLTAR
jgi:hypothetical protein